MYYDLTVPNCPTIILNSTGNLAKALPAISTFPRINTYFDGDDAGRDALQTLVTANLPVIDRSDLYDGYNDFNAFLMGTARKPVT